MNPVLRIATARSAFTPSSPTIRPGCCWEAEFCGGRSASGSRLAGGGDGLLLLVAPVRPGAVGAQQALKRRSATRPDVNLGDLGPKAGEPRAGDADRVSQRSDRRTAGDGRSAAAAAALAGHLLPAWSLETRARRAADDPLALQRPAAANRSLVRQHDYDRALGRYARAVLRLSAVRSRARPPEQAAPIRRRSPAAHPHGRYAKRKIRFRSCSRAASCTTPAVAIHSADASLDDIEIDDLLQLPDGPPEGQPAAAPRRADRSGARPANDLAGIGGQQDSRVGAPAGRRL